MTGTDYAIILATLVAPVLAVQAQKWIERFRDSNRRKEQIFNVLMTTRGNRLSDKHVEALNTVGMEYHHYKNGAGADVVKAWRGYIHFLNSNKITPDQIYKPLEEQVLKELNDRFVQLLCAMSNFLGYDYDEVSIRTDYYMPSISDRNNENSIVINEGLAAVFRNQYAVPVRAYTKPIQESAGSNSERQPQTPKKKKK